MPSSRIGDTRWQASVVEHRGQAGCGTATQSVSVSPGRHQAASSVAGRAACGQQLSLSLISVSLPPSPFLSQARQLKKHKEKNSGAHSIGSEWFSGGRQPHTDSRVSVWRRSQ